MEIDIDVVVSEGSDGRRSKVTEDSLEKVRCRGRPVPNLTQTTFELAGEVEDL